MIAYKFHIDIFRHSIKSYKTYWLGFSIANNFVIPTDLVQIMSFILLQFFLILSVLFGGLVVSYLKTNYKTHTIKLTLAFSGGFLLAIVFCHLLPDLYQHNFETTGFFILLGFLGLNPVFVAKENFVTQLSNFFWVWGPCAGWGIGFDVVTSRVIEALISLSSSLLP